MLIRRARAEETAAVGELTLAAYVADGLLGPQDWYARQLQAADRRAAEAELYVATAAEDRTLLGTVTFCEPRSPWAELAVDGEAEFRMLAVARGRGVGAALAEHCIGRAVESGGRALVLSSHPDMHAAHRLYARLGFRRTPERDWQPGPTVTLWAYRLELTA